MEFLAGLLVGMLGIIATIVVARHQSRSPRLKVICRSPLDGNPGRLDCAVFNDGRGEARDVYISFFRTLPKATSVSASPEVDAQLIKATLPPDLTASPKASALLKAFAVRLPRVAAKDKVEFQLKTADPDNQRSATQVLRIEREIASVLVEFGTQLKAKYPEAGEQWDSDLILSARVKKNNFFVPAQVSYERGNEAIEYLAEEEELALAHLQDLYAQYKSQFPGPIQNRPAFKAPVIRIETAVGERTYAVFPPFIKTYIEAAVSVGELKRQGKLVIYPPVPHSYE